MNKNGWIYEIKNTPKSFWTFLFGAWFGTVSIFIGPPTDVGLKVSLMVIAALIMLASFLIMAGLFDIHPPMYEARRNNPNERV